MTDVDGKTDDTAAPGTVTAAVPCDIDVSDTAPAATVLGAVGIRAISSEGTPAKVVGAICVGSDRPLISEVGRAPGSSASLRTVGTPTGEYDGSGSCDTVADGRGTIGTG